MSEKPPSPEELNKLHEKALEINKKVDEIVSTGETKTSQEAVDRMELFDLLTKGEIVGYKHSGRGVTRPTSSPIFDLTDKCISEAKEEIKNSGMSQEKIDRFFATILITQIQGDKIEYIRKFFSNFNVSSEVIDSEEVKKVAIDYFSKSLRGDYLNYVDDGIYIANLFKIPESVQTHFAVKKLQDLLPKYHRKSGFSRDDDRIATILHLLQKFNIGDKISNYPDIQKLAEKEFIQTAWAFNGEEKLRFLATQLHLSPETTAILDDDDYKKYWISRQSIKTEDSQIIYKTMENEANPYKTEFGYTIPKAFKLHSDFMKEHFQMNVIYDIGCGNDGYYNAMNLLSVNPDIDKIILVEPFPDEFMESRFYNYGKKFKEDTSMDELKKKITLVKKDGLSFLLEQEVASGNVIMSGVDNTIIENSQYASRLMQEIFRVVPEDGFFVSNSNTGTDYVADDLFNFKNVLPGDTFDIYTKKNIANDLEKLK